MTMWGKWQQSRGSLDKLLQIDFSKSSLCGVNVPQQDVALLAQVMGCKVESLPIKYLGLPLGANPRRIKTWDPVIVNIEKKLAVWKQRVSTTGGRLTLINSSMGSLPVYYMSMFKMPVAIARKIEKLQRQFFWGDSVDKKKLHLVKWDLISRSKKRGGLGIKRLMQQNSSLLAKWWCRFNKDKDSLWVKTIRGKYGIGQNCWLPQMPLSRFVSNIWEDICSIGEQNSSIGSIICNGFRIKVNSGNETLSWRVVIEF